MTSKSTYTAGGFCIGILVAFFLSIRYGLINYSPFVILSFSILGFIYALYEEKNDK